MKICNASTSKNTKQKTREKLDQVSILVPKTNSFFTAFWCPFRALGRPGAKLVPEPPPKATGMVADPIFHDSWWFLDGLLVAFCVRPLVCRHVFLQLFWDLFLVDLWVPPLVCHHQNKKHGGGFCAQRTEIQAPTCELVQDLTYCRVEMASNTLTRWLIAYLVHQWEY